LSQRQLSRLAGISWTQIGEIETGTRGKHPSPLTLRALAEGLATIPPENTEVDQDKFRVYYEQLMRDADYLAGIESGQPNGIQATDIAAWLEDEVQDPEFTELLMRLIEAFRKADGAGRQGLRTATEISVAMATGGRTRERERTSG